jgi:hypothetical protein
MRRYVEVFWCPFFGAESKDLEIFSPLNVVTQKPKPLTNLLFKERGGAKYLDCPAVSDAIKNIFVITAPFDLAVKIDREADVMTTDRYGQHFYDVCTIFRNKDTPLTNPALLTLPPQLLFYSKEPVIARTTDVPIIISSSAVNTRLIPGQYDISKWVRPMDWTFELINGNEVFMKRGDPLFAITFNTRDNLPVKLTQVDFTQDLFLTAASLTGVKTYIPKLKLKQAYEIAKDFLRIRMPK